MPLPQAMARVNSEFAGRNVGEFFVDYGSGAGESSLPDGGHFYQWVSLESASVSRPASAVTYPGGHYAAIADNSNGEFVSGYCKVGITTDTGDKIVKITLLNDSIGKYGSSRCAEIFAQGPD
jgi:hypothetical protein